MEDRERKKAIEKTEERIDYNRHLISLLKREIKKDEDRIRRLKDGFDEQ